VPIRPRELMVPLLPLRELIEAPRGMRLVGADYSQQELRLLAHFVGGLLLAQYQADPLLDMHAFAAALIRDRVGISVTRAQAKTVGFGVLYGMGQGELSRRLKLDNASAGTLKRAYLRELGIDALDAALREAQQCITWGGRTCPVEPPTMFEDGERDWAYKLINTLIQGSAADQTKEAMARFYERHPELLALSVHDELIAFAPTGDAKQVYADLTECMSGIEGFSLAFPVDGGIYRRWSELK